MNPKVFSRIAAGQHADVLQGSPKPLTCPNYKARAKALAWLKTRAYEAVIRCEAAGSLHLVAEHMNDLEREFYQAPSSSAVTPNKDAQTRGGAL